MALPPEVLFHRYFQSRPHLQRDGYRGKADLDRLPPQPLPVSLLESLQGMMNEALVHENTNIPEHVDHDPFHFDYIDSNDPNALAFCSDGYSFRRHDAPPRTALASIHSPERIAFHYVGLGCSAL